MLVFDINGVVLEFFDPVVIYDDRFIYSNEVSWRQDGKKLLQSGVMIAYFVVNAFNTQAIACILNEKDVIENHFDIHFFVAYKCMAFHFWLTSGCIIIR